jgi:lipoprotein-anchoring transpeptidase ErfK/SrfK
MPTSPVSDTFLTRRRALGSIGLTAVGIAGVAGLAACSNDDKAPNWDTGTSPSPQPPIATVSITGPATDAVDVPASAEIVFTATDADVAAATVKLVDAAGVEVTGAPHPDGKGWLPTNALKFATPYTVTVTVTGTDGKQVSKSSGFTTMAAPTKLLSVSSFLNDNAVMGCGMPLIFHFSAVVPKAERANVQRRMFVETTPAQEGIWTWYNDKEIHWRPKEFWQANTKVNVKVQVGGLPIGTGGLHGKRDSTLVCSVGSVLKMEVNDSNKQMVVTRDGAVIKTIPVSLGKANNLSSSGVMVVMEKKAKTVFDTFNDPTATDRYRTEVEFAQRLTWGGEFIHAAPWSVQHQGVRNVSHGCINMSTANAKWLFDQTRLGDPVITKGTARRLTYGNGWTDWDRSWEEYVKGSAIPYVPPAPPAPVETGATPTATPST